jgi:predicted O-linked N-acetylglucosamine transferase (SPINDLY family)
MGNPELVAYSEEEYIEKTIQLINSPEKIENYKKSLNKNFNKLMEPKEFMKNYENKLQELYNKNINIEEKISITL